jgi:hypothetical protein
LLSPKNEAAVSAVIAAAGEQTSRRYVEFFIANIRDRRQYDSPGQLRLFAWAMVRSPIADCSARTSSPSPLVEDSHCKGKIHQEFCFFRTVLNNVGDVKAALRNRPRRSIKGGI